MMPLELILPLAVPTSQANATTPFRIIGQSAYLWFEPRGPVLIVSFDNLATVDTPYPRAPWVTRQIAELGYSLLGVQTTRKDWFRQTDAPDLLKQLVASGFFDSFETIVFTGASMGGFAAINFAPLVPQALVLALSPQSTMNKTIAPFEHRFPWAVRNSDWENPVFLDAADAIPDIPHTTIVYDPFVPEDKAHALRLAGPNTQLARVPHATHEAVRTVMKAGAFNVMLQEFVETGALGNAFWSAMRGRRTVRKWARAFNDNIAASHHERLALRAFDLLLAQDNYLFAHKARRALLEAHPELLDR
jgi:hypothetical protein